LARARSKRKKKKKKKSTPVLKTKVPVYLDSTLVLDLRPQELGRIHATLQNRIVQESNSHHRKTAPAPLGTTLHRVIQGAQDCMDDSGVPKIYKLPYLWNVVVNHPQQPHLFAPEFNPKLYTSTDHAVH
jgi:hypothetical protein